MLMMRCRSVLGRAVPNRPASRSSCRSARHGVDPMSQRELVMMSIVSSWVIVASVLTAPTEGGAAAIVVPTDTASLSERYPAAVEIYHCDFDPAEFDRDQDSWPKGWQRRAGSGFPHYVDIALVDAPSPGNDRCLRIELDGGAATAYGPRVDVSRAQ